MKKKHEHIIESVRPGSIAEELGIEPGDILLEIDGQVIEDIFDYQFYVESEELLVVIRKANGEEWELEIEKEYEDDIEKNNLTKLKPGSNIELMSKE